MINRYVSVIFTLITAQMLFAQTTPPRGYESKTPVTAIRTNLLLPLLNAGVEVPLGNRFSVAADVYYPFIPRQLYNSVSPANKNCFQMLGGYLEGRCYLGSRHEYGDSNRKYRLSGHHLNVVFGGCYYDYEANWKGRQGEAFALGFGYGYTLPLGNGGVMMEFDLNIGAIYNLAHPYTVYEKDGWLIRDTNERYETIMTEKGFILGYPVKAGISLVIPIHEDKKNK